MSEIPEPTADDMRENIFAAWEQAQEGMDGDWWWGIFVRRAYHAERDLQEARATVLLQSAQIELLNETVMQEREARVALEKRFAESPEAWFVSSDPPSSLFPGVLYDAAMNWDPRYTEPRRVRLVPVEEP